MKKRILLGLTIGGVVFAAVFGAAASLAVDGNSLQAGADTSLKCDANGVNTTYTVGWNATAKNNLVSEVKVNGIDVETVTTPESCTGQKLTVTLTDSTGAALETKTLTGTVAAATETVTGFTSAASAVEGVHVVIAP